MKKLFLSVVVSLSLTTIPFSQTAVAGPLKDELLSGSTTSIVRALPQEIGERSGTVAQSSGSSLKEFFDENKGAVIVVAGLAAVVIVGYATYRYFYPKTKRVKQVEEEKFPLSSPRKSEVEVDDVVDNAVDEGKVKKEENGSPSTARKRVKPKDRTSSDDEEESNEKEVRNGFLHSAEIDVDEKETGLKTPPLDISFGVDEEDRSQEDSLSVLSEELAQRLMKESNAGLPPISSAPTTPEKIYPVSKTNSFVVKEVEEEKEGNSEEGNSEEENSGEE